MRNMRIRSAAPAPSAARTAISTRRSSARTRNRLAAFAAAIARTSTTAARISQSTLESSPSIDCLSGSTRAVRPASSSSEGVTSEYASARRGIRRLSSLAAEPGDALGVSRATPVR